MIWRLLILLGAMLANGAGGGSGSGSGEGSGGAGGEEGGDQDPASGGDPGGGEDDPPDEGLPKTKAELTALLDQHAGRIVQRERDRAEKARAEEEEKRKRADLEESERMRLELEDERTKSADLQAGAARELTSSRAAVLAASRNVAPDRIPTFLRLVDLSDALARRDEDGTWSYDDGAIGEAIDRALKVAPEFTGAKGTPGADPGTPGGDGGKIWTEAEIEAMPAAEYEQHRQSILEAMAEGRVKS